MSTEQEIIMIRKKIEELEEEIKMLEECKALARAACDDMGQSYMHGICAVVAQRESDLLDAKNSGARQTERSWQDDVEA